MDALTIKDDGSFDSGAQPVTTASTLQEIGRLIVHGAAYVLLEIIVGPQTIAHLTLTQGAVQDDGSAVTVAADAGFNTVALADVAYVIPAMSFPLAAGSVYQVRLNGLAAEYTLLASTAGAAGGTVQIRGTVGLPNRS